MRNLRFFFSLIGASILGAFFALLFFPYFHEQAQYPSIEQHQQTQLQEAWHPDSVSFVVPEGLNFIYAAHRSLPSVVHIKTSYLSNASNTQEDPLKDMFRQFHGDRYTPYPRESSGSGVIISDDGFIVTNHHVIDNASLIEVILNDKRVYIAELIGSDPSTDLALLRIQAQNLDFIPYGNSDDLQVGEWVLAVGNPFDLKSTVTAGIVSAKGRNINLIKDNQFAIESFIQTDAAVNPGNSGGALVNLRGELIGVNTAIATRSGYSQGYSFAVPIRLVKKVMDDLMNYGTIQRALLGVSIREVDAALANEEKLNHIQGVFVARVNKNSAAQAAGILPGDIIYEVDEMPVNSTASLQTAIATHRPGDRVQIRYIRKQNKRVTVAILRNQEGRTSPQTKIHLPSSETIFGAEFGLISEFEKNRLGIRAGVKVTHLNPGRFLDSGIRPGFIILKIDDNTVSSPQDLLKLFKNTRKTLAVDGIYPDGQRSYYAISQ